MNLRSVMPLDAGPRPEYKRLRNVCWSCATRWWSREVCEACPKCGASFTDRDKWKATPFQPSRLEGAREFHALDQDELSAKTAMPIADFESGAAVPTFAQILQLASVLDFPPAFLTHPKPWPKLDEGSLHFFCVSEPCVDEGCGENADAFCDFPLAGGGTCDAAICSQHGMRVGEDTDYCDKHSKRIAV